MKTTIFNKKALAFFGAAAILLAAVFTTGCKTDAGSGDPAPETFAVAFSVDGANGTLKAKADGIAETDKSPIVVQKGKTVTFTATPKNGYKVDKWTITGGAFEAGTGTEGSLTAKVKITADTKVNVSFKAIVYTSVSFTNLNAYLKDTASSADINYIEVTGLTAADLKGDASSYPFKPGRLGKILNDNLTKKVALKLSEVSGLTDMSCCFYGCESLIQAPAIPSSVTNMEQCFYGCKSLTQAPVIPNGVTDMRYCFYGCEKITAVTLKCNYNSQQIDGIPAFNYAFKDCKKLTANSIKVPAGQLQTYKDNAGMMGTTADRFVAGE